MARILYEAENFNKPGGTGIKTYVENLAQAARSIGFETGALLSAQRAVNGKDPLLAEIDFYDARQSTSVLQRFVHTPTRYVFGAPMGLRTTPLPRTGAVIRPDDARSAETVAFDRVHLSCRLSENARHHLVRYGRLARLRHSEQLDIFHATHAVPLYAPRAANIYTIHDIVPLRLPYTTRDNKKVFLETLREICRRADHVVTVSEHSRRDILSIVDIPEHKITNTYQSVQIPSALLSQSDDDVARLVEHVHGLQYKKYFLFVGALEPKKNVSRLIDSFAASGVSDPLVIAGGLGWDYDDAVARVEQDHFHSYRFSGDRAVRERKVRRLEYLSFPHLVGLIRGAKALLFPSLYEGFGLPVLEAMMLGTPVMTSRTSSLPEVAGDAALLVDPLDVPAMTRAIRALDSDSDLRAGLAQLGLVQAQKFSPDAYRERVRGVYRSVLGSAAVAANDREDTSSALALGNPAFAQGHVGPTPANAALAAD